MMHTHYDSKLLLLGIFLGESSLCAPGHISEMFTAVLFLTAKNIKQHKWPLTREKIIVFSKKSLPSPVHGPMDLTAA